MRVRLLLASLVTVAACGGGSESSTVTPPVTSGNKTVDIYTVASEFVDQIKTISVGDTVRWNFALGTDGLGHNVRFTPRINGSPADIGTQQAPLKSGTQSRVFPIAGDFHYVCDLHGSMVGEIIAK